MKFQIDSRIRSGEIFRTARLQTLLPILRTALLVIITLTILITVLTEFGFNTSPLLASAGILSAAIAFGSQNLVKDFVTGLFLLMENTMQVGDTVNVAGISGVVEYLSIRAVRIRANDGSLHTIPFSSVNIVNNINKGCGSVIVKINVTIESNIAEVYDLLKKTSIDMKEDPKCKHFMLSEIEILGIDELDGASITIIGQMKASDKNRLSVKREFNYRILKIFKEHNIRFANPNEISLKGKHITTDI